MAITRILIHLFFIIICDIIAQFPALVWLLLRLTVTPLRQFEKHDPPRTVRKMEFYQTKEERLQYMKFSTETE